MPERVTATPAALEVLGRLRAQHGDLIVHLSGGCCDGSSPMCLRASDLPAGPHDVRLGTLGGDVLTGSAGQCGCPAAKARVRSEEGQYVAFEEVASCVSLSPSSPPRSWCSRRHRP